MPRPRVTFSQERHDVVGLLRAAEGDQQQGVVRRDVGVGSWLRSCPTLAGRCSPATARVLGRPGALRFSADRAGRAAADLDDHARHRAAGHRPRPAPTAWPGRVSAAYTIANAADGDRAGPARSTGSARRGCCPSSPRSSASAIVAARRRRSQAGWPDPAAFAARGGRRRGVPADRLVRAGPLVLRARRRPDARCRRRTRWSR